MTDFRNKYSVLQDFFGHSQFRNGQEQIIDSILAGRDCLGVMPTGAGKSMCYQIPALMFDGITIVVSPLISLMKDQVNSLIQSGVRAAYLNSSLTAAQYEMAISNAARGMYKIIYVAPERLMTGSFLSLASSVKISMLAVDEAHCVSQWAAYQTTPAASSRRGTSACAMTRARSSKARSVSLTSRGNLNCCPWAI